MKKIKYAGMLVAALFLGMQVVNAQNPGEQGKKKGKRMTYEQMTDMKCNRIINELGLDDKTAAKFTEMYKRYMQELQDVRQANGLRKPKVKKEGEDGKPQMTPPTDAEVEKMMRNRFTQSRKTLDIREKYYDEFRKILSPKQVAKIYDQDQTDRNKFRKEMNRRNGMKKPNGN